MRGAFGIVFAAVVLAPAAVTAGRSPHGWLYGTEVLPERGAELQTWVAEENGKADGTIHDSTMWWGALVGITDQLELALPVEMLWRRVDGLPASFTFQRFGVEARYRFVTQDPVDAPALAPLVRVAVKRDVGVRDRVRAEADVVTSYDYQRIRGLVDLGMVGDLGGDDSSFEVRLGGGVSIQVIGELRLGLETYAQIPLDARDSWAVVGPDIGWTHGRFWLTAAFGFGVYNIDTAPRLVWGIAF